MALARLVMRGLPVALVPIGTVHFTQLAEMISHRSNLSDLLAFYDALSPCGRESAKTNCVAIKHPESDWQCAPALQCCSECHSAEALPTLIGSFHGIERPLIVSAGL